ncbi:PREDICTED: myosin-M heavy chain isoform X1 [Camelina sativa]|uniref:Myosin-M heavy chain isoform X1 n=1 Tax=Camelina sativa TaxID=90675 RepID=A0ABM0ZKN4_CAMSA|nr:PREDICTED: myosin-M heavy chain isoform X1 [Camelina sativa]
MAKSNRSKASERVIGNGEVTPIQVAFLVDRYLCDNRFLKTRSLFRSEASSLISNSPVREVPNSLLPLNEILNEYILLKKEKMMIDQEKSKLDQEKSHVQNLLNGMQDVMNAYNSTVATPPPPPPPPAISAAAPTDNQVVDASTSKQNNNFGVSSSGCTVYNTSNVIMPVSLPGNKRVGSFTAPCLSQSTTKKRKSPEVSLGAPSVSRKGMKKLQQADKVVANYLTFQTSSEIQMPVNNGVANKSSDLMPSVAKCLFNKSDMLSPPTSSACPRTPPKQASNQSDRSVSPQQEVTPTNCTIVTKERITVSPLKQIGSYTVERSHMVSSFSPVKSDLKMSSKRDHVKGRLNFDDTEATMHLDAPAAADMVPTSSSGSEAEADLFDIDFSNIDLLSEDFSFSELLVDFDLGCQGMPDPCLPQPSNFHIESASGSSPESRNTNLEPDQVVSEYTSTVTEMTQGKDMNTQGSDSMTTVKSITKCLRILSPAKNCRQRVTID